jgi:hypothetical protein
MRSKSQANRTHQAKVVAQTQTMNVHRDVRPVGSTTVTVGDWKQEADCSWAPASAIAKDDLGILAVDVDRNHKFHR